MGSTSVGGRVEEGEELLAEAGAEGESGFGHLTRCCLPGIPEDDARARQPQEVVQGYHEVGVLRPKQFAQCYQVVGSGG